MPVTPTASSSRFSLEIAGANVPSLKKFSGLGPQADIAQSSVGPGAPPKKNVANFHWTGGRATVGLGMGKAMADWMRAAFDAHPTSRNGVFRVADFNGKLRYALNFSNALITDFTVPRLDAASKEAGLFELGFQAEQVNWVAGKGEVVTTSPEPRPKAFVVSNFKVSIGNLPCARVVSIEAFTWSCSLTGADVGGPVSGGPKAARITVPDLKLSISAADYGAWAEAARAWFVDGKRLDTDEMTGRITLLGPDLKEELAFIDLVHVGFKSFTHPEAVLNSEQVERFTVELYVEQMQFTIKDPG